MRISLMSIHKNWWVGFASVSGMLKLMGVQEIQHMVRKAIQERGTGSSEKPKAIYPAILENERVHEDEKRFARLADDAILLIAAGTDAPGRALAMTLYFVLRNPEVHEKVRAELCACWPDSSVEPGLTVIERLPYFV